MSAQRLGRLLGSLTLVLGLAVAASIVTEGEFRTSGVDWQMPTLNSVVR
ncbi:hypothetical protein SAMN05443287_103499 [Micromonospora phaseoli]|uniref:Uncharacterized protein n=1 Tax=Micromonospora phaseoli TaxID=1144548 RepID=A0A1H6XBR8_9ACTN|nr:hypothetical protein CLV64_102497 [Micromonospora phaseoli]SEJ24914.1 hypothetical protein SAMN05443287_103499 [Micromonospora phaseoli]